MIRCCTKKAFKAWKDTEKFMCKCIGEHRITESPASMSPTTSESTH